MVVLDSRPEFAQLLDPFARLAAGNQRRVDCADRCADHPSVRNSGLVQGFVNADLIGAEGPAALEDEHGLAELCHFVCERLHAHFLSTLWERSGGVGRPMSPVMSRALRW